MQKYYKIIAVTFGTIILGAVGSGVWEYILDPFVSASTKAILNIATLGVKSFKNDLYIEVAKGFHEKASYLLLSKVDIILVIGLLFYSFINALRIKSLIYDRDLQLKKIHRIESGGKLEENHWMDELKDIKDELKCPKIQYLLKTSYVLIGIAVLLLSAQYVSSKRSFYINEAITYYQQSKSIIAPYISSKDLLLFDSRFSQIKTPNDYYEIMNQLKSVAKNEKVDLPDFDAW